jgi:hypothetical protein
MTRYDLFSVVVVVLLLVGAFSGSEGVWILPYGHKLAPASARLSTIAPLHLESTHAKPYSALSLCYER